jgi:hypothetical protein
MATHVLLTSEAFIKDITNISDNIEGKYLLSAIREAQEIRLRQIVGSALLDKLKDIVSNRATNAAENRQYKALIEQCQYYLAYQTIAELPMKISYKLTNLGTVRTVDDKVQSASSEEISKVQFYYQSKADFYAHELQSYLLRHAKEYPELNANNCHEIRKNLHSAATCGLWLGGIRGKKTW